MTVSGFFEVPADRLMSAPFEELLAGELSDRERFRRIEKKLRPDETVEMPNQVVQLVIDPDIERPREDR